MGAPKVAKWGGKSLHFSVGAILRSAREDRYFLFERKKPCVYTGLAGHTEASDASSIDALGRVVKHTSGLVLATYDLALDELVQGDACDGGVDQHRWRVYFCGVTGTPKLDARVFKSAAWYTAQEVAGLKCDPRWDYFFRRLRITGSTDRVS